MVPSKHVMHTTRAGSWKCRTELSQKTVVDYILIYLSKHRVSAKTICTMLLGHVLDRTLLIIFVAEFEEVDVLRK